MFTRARVRNVLSALGVIAVFLAVMPYFHYQAGGTFDSATLEHLRAHPDKSPYTEDYTLGWDFSPLAHFHGERTLKVTDAGVAVGKSSRVSIGWISWSSLTLVVGIGLLWVASRLKRQRPAGDNLG